MRINYKVSLKVFAKKVRLLVLSWIKIIPIHNNVVLLNSRVGGRFADSPKYIALNLASGSNLKVYFAVKRRRFFCDICGIEFVEENSFKYFWLKVICKVFVTNNGGIASFPWKKEQIVINTWHGQPYKRIGLDTYTEDNGGYIWRLMRERNVTSRFLSQSSMMAEVLKNKLLVDEDKIWEIGIPRNDLMVNSSLKAQKNIREKIGWENDVKYAIYAPTGRGHIENIVKEFDVERVSDALSKCFGGEWEIVLRFHPGAGGDNLNPQMQDFSDYDDMQELLVAADVLITDFSSTMWDFMLSKKPVFIYAEELENYLENTGLYVPFVEWPFPKATNIDEFVKVIEEFDEDDYIEKCREHYNKLGGCETGKATDLVCEYISRCCEE